MKTAHLIACHECDLVHQLGEVPLGGAARCSRCGSSLYRPKRDSINRTLALTLTGLILYIIANTHPFLGFKIGAQVRETTLATGIYQLYQQGYGSYGYIGAADRCGRAGRSFIEHALHLCCRCKRTGCPAIWHAYFA